MAKKKKSRSTMETCFKVLQLKFDRKLSNRTIGLTLNISPSTIVEVLARFKASSTPWPLPETLTPEAIESLIFPEKKASMLTPVLPDWLHIDTEMRRPGGRGNFCGRNTGLRSENGHWGTPSFAAATGAGRKIYAVPCDRSTGPERSSLSTSVAPQCRLSILILARCAAQPSSWPSWARQTTPMLRPVRSRT